MSATSDSDYLVDSQEEEEEESSQDEAIDEDAPTPAKFTALVQALLSQLKSTTKNPKLLESRVKEISTFTSKLVTVLNRVEDLETQWAALEWDHTDPMINHLFKIPLEFLQGVREMGEDVMTDSLDALRRGTQEKRIVRKRRRISKN